MNTVPIDRRLAASGLRRAVLRTDLSDRQIYNRLNVSASTFGSWQRGDTFPNRRNLLAFCEITQCTPDDVLSGYPDFADECESA